MSDVTMTEQTTPATAEATRAEVCITAVADLFRDSGEILASAFGLIPTIAVRLARATFAPDLAISNGESHLVVGDWAVDEPAPRTVEGFIPFRTIFDLLWHGNRHVVMIPSQIDRHGNMNISAIGDFDRPKRQLIGARGAPGNSICHPTSYWVPRHSTRAFVGRVDVVCGVGNDRAAAVGTAARHHDLRAVVTNLGVLTFGADGTLRLASVHPGVEVDEVVQATGFDLGDVRDVPTTRLPTAEELHLIRTVFDPRGLRNKEVPA